ncbi:hypothetical protein BDV28DRAFT_130445 [Aspergillus coremiiformis]|uniref:HIT-type domain-containing protein n=1 Tax=Aspergillus coremiiformis TaxID=138285 RepID=A0A5N6ZAH5_9EURO|nr:hypothetical protein BDV28DRAFT_130445 [Aspergillus coremiiformis]
MYHVELLPSATTHLTPGWTYVPDRGFPAKAAITPTIGRKRSIRDPGSRGDVSSRQANAIIRHLAELDRENHKDVHIQIPVKQKDAAGRGTRGKVTSNVRRILQSQKTFRNYLDDEEAALAQAAQSVTQRPPANKVTKPSSLRRSSTPATTPKPESSRQKKQSSTAPAPQRTLIPSAETSAEPPNATTEEDAEKGPGNKQGLIKTEHDNDPLLRSYIPSAPSERVMQALLAEPPLTYNASRAGPPVTMKSLRYFCCMCGYWGKIRCKNCPSRTCGLDCYKMHEDSRCGAFY